MFESFIRHTLGYDAEQNLEGNADQNASKVQADLKGKINGNFLPETTNFSEQIHLNT